jgi:hypothetical protein
LKIIWTDALTESGARNHIVGISEVYSSECSIQLGFLPFQAIVSERREAFGLFGSAKMRLLCAHMGAPTIPLLLYRVLKEKSTRNYSCLFIFIHEYSALTEAENAPSLQSMRAASHPRESGKSEHMSNSVSISSRLR